MKKIVLTEKQSKKLVNKLINEQARSWHDLIHDDGRQHVEVECDFDYYHLTYKGGQIDDILKNKLNISFLVEPEWRSYGIKSISVYDIRGPEEIELEIAYYPANSGRDDDSVEEGFNLKLDWDNMLQTEDDETLGWFGVSNEMSIELANDGQGGLVAKSINIGVHGF